MFPPPRKKRPNPVLKNDFTETAAPACRRMRCFLLMLSILVIAEVLRMFPSEKANIFSISWLTVIRFRQGFSWISIKKSRISRPKKEASCKASLNPWEAGVVKEELEGEAVCWLRNLDRKSCSLGIPYEVNGMVSTMYPDLIIVRSGTYGYIFDIMEPHDESRKDNYPKAVGLAKFADQHWDKFGRIQLIRRKPGPDGRDHFYRLDMSNQQIRSRVRAIHSNPELDHIFDECATLN